jgi:hypothetical protein
VIEISLSFTGGLSDDHEIDLYDGAQALVGFQRSLAITTHLILNGEVITQAPKLKGATILSRPPEDGSWKTTAVIATTIFTLGTAPKDTPIGHLISSAYDYVVSESLGFHVDYDKSLGQQIEEHRRANPDSLVPALRETQFDSVIEKCETALRDLHRPIVFSETAHQGRIIERRGSTEKPIGPPLDWNTWGYIAHTHQTDTPQIFEGWVSSYNMNTFKGRIYINKEGRPIPFQLSEEVRGVVSVGLITSSLTMNARQRLIDTGKRYFSAFRNETSNGRLKSLLILRISDSIDTL